jgi:UDP-N-acetylmuramoyl-L-alanyl-D-glutamate--2,6-diaminopimelate ligase
MEVSSHALDQGRVDGVQFEVGVFTNLSQDHLDYHQTMDAYFEAKSRLFEDAVSQTAVIFADSEAGQSLLAKRDSRCVAVSLEDAGNVIYESTSTTFTWRGFEITAPIVGSMMLSNLLLAAESCVALGFDAKDVAACLAEVTTAEGRLQQIDGPANAPRVMVDYAHTPDALARLLSDVRPTMAGGALTVVFGCGGNRDRGKRPVMGSVASELSDRVIVTTDNPRNEVPEAIIAEIMAGIDQNASVQIIEDRRLAIETAITNAGAGDVVVIAGKGHEKTQEFATETLSFDDVAVAIAVLNTFESRSAC